MGRSADLLELYEGVLEGAGTALRVGRKATVAEVRRELIKRQQRELAGAVANLGKGRKAVAHPIANLRDRIVEALAEPVLDGDRVGAHDEDVSSAPGAGLGGALPGAELDEALEPLASPGGLSEGFVVDVGTQTGIGGFGGGVDFGVQADVGGPLVGTGGHRSAHEAWPVVEKACAPRVLEPKAAAIDSETVNDGTSGERDRDEACLARRVTRDREQTSKERDRDEACQARRETRDREQTEREVRGDEAACEAEEPTPGKAPGGEQELEELRRNAETLQAALQAELHKFFLHALEVAGYQGVELHITQFGTEILIRTTHDRKVRGKNGSGIRALQEAVRARFGFPEDGMALFLKRVRGAGCGAAA